MQPDIISEIKSAIARYPEGYSDLHGEKVTRVRDNLFVAVAKHGGEAYIAKSAEDAVTGLRLSLVVPHL